MTDAEPARPGTAQRWIGIDAHRLLWEQFDDEYFVFNPATGHTHLLNALGAATLHLLTDQALDRDQLQARLREQAGIDESQTSCEALDQALATHLRQLAAIGLIEPMAP